MKAAPLVLCAVGILLVSKCWYDAMRFMYHREHLRTARAIISDARQLLQPQFDTTGPHEIFSQAASQVLENSMGCGVRAAAHDR